MRRLRWLGQKRKNEKTEMVRTEEERRRIGED